MAGLKIHKRNAPYFIVGAGFLWSLYGFYSFATVRLAQMESERNAKIAVLTKKQTEMKRLKEFAQNIEAIKIKLRELNLQLESALETMPKNYSLGGLLRRLAILATNSGVDLQTFSPGGAPQRQQKDFFETLEVSFGLQGTFNDTLVFLDQISRLKRLIKVVDVTINSKEQGSRSGPESLIPVKSDVLARIRLYRFLE